MTGPVATLACLLLLASPAISAPSVDSVLSPPKGAILIYGETYEIRWSAPEVQAVSIQLWEETPGGLNKVPVDIVPYPFDTENDGSFMWTVPSTVPSGNNYRIQLHDFARQAPSPAFSGLFSIAEKQGDCEPGFFSETGKDPCMPCEIGHFWESPTSCIPCPEGKTTEDRGAATVDKCSVDQENPLDSYHKVYQSFLLGSNAGGLNLEDHTMKTLEECAALCEQDKACKSFDAGNPATGGRYFQSGDCFLSYDNRFTIKAGSYRTGDRYLGLKDDWVNTCADNSTCRVRYREPVCGSDGKTYVNQYCANCNGVQQTTASHCPVATCSDGSACTGTRRLTCSQNGQQYFNQECAECNGVTGAAFGRCPMDRCKPPNTRRCGPFSSRLPYCTKERMTIEFNCLSCWNIPVGDVLLDKPCPIDTCSDGNACPNSESNDSMDPVCGFDDSNTYWNEDCARCNGQTRFYEGACSGGVTQLDYYEKMDAEPVKDVYYTKFSNCLIEGSDAGGRHENKHSQEVCAQLCFNDVNCKSFDGGKGAKQDDCFLSYDDRKTAGDDLVCDNALYDYYERASPFLFSINYDPELIVSDWMARNALADSVLTQLRSIPGIPGDADIPISLTGENGKVVVSFNLAFDGNKDVSNEMAAYRAAIQAGMFVRHDGQSYPATEYQPQSCPPGFASPTGATPQCEKCPVDTYSNGAGTVCLECPPDTQSPSGSSSVVACRAPQTNDKLLFTFGSEWVGSYNTFITDGNITRKAGGGLHMQVVQSTDAGVVRILGTFEHGEFCDETIQPGASVPVCRTAGIAQWYLKGTVRDDVYLSMTFDGWIGITDRTFNTEDLDGVVLVNKDNNVFEGTYGGGTFSVTERCQASSEVGTFSTSDKFVGTYTCDRLPTGGIVVKVGEQDIRRLDVLVTKSNPNTGAVEATVDFEHADGPGQYMAKGTFNAETGQLQLTPSEWISDYPNTVTSHELTGRLSDNGEFIFGQVTRHPGCECIGIQAPEDVGTVGKSCGDWGRVNYEWCYVSPECPEARETETTGFFRAPCGEKVQACEQFKVSRVCAEAVPLCDVNDGWTAHNFRCYKGFGNDSTFEEAQAVCAENEAVLASVHSNNENAILEDIQRTLEAPVWLGLTKTENTEFSWIDRTHFDFLAWNRDAGEPQPANNCVTASAIGNTTEFKWQTTACDSTNKFVCRKPPIGRNASCECTGETDTVGLGSFCKRWKDFSLAEWCFVSEGCPRAKHADRSSEVSEDGKELPDLWWAFCFTEDETTTTPGSTTTPMVTSSPSTDLNCNENDETTYQSGNQCLPCTTSNECDTGTFLRGACTTYASPTCAACNQDCLTCDGPTRKDCLTCITGKFFSTADKICVDECGSHEYQDGQTCRPCDSRCGTCDGPREDDCISCDQVTGSALFLSPEGICTPNCDENGFWKDRSAFVCRPCTTCTSDQFIDEACSEFADTVCRETTKCLDTEFELKKPDLSTDRVCRTKRTSCNGGEEIVAPSTDVSDLICRACPAGTVDDDGNFRSKCVDCPAGTYTPPQSTGDCGECPAGTTDHDSDPSTECRPCTEGQSFQDTPGATGACKALSTCPVGMGALSEATTVRDIVCETCRPGFFSDSDSSERCAIKSVCSPGQGSEVDNSNLRDNNCQDCADGTFKDVAGAFPCRPVAICGTGTQESEPPSTSTDRKCGECPSGLFKSTVDQSDPSGGSCQPWTECGPDQFVLSLPSRDRDRLCKDRQLCSNTQYQAFPPPPDQDRDCMTLTQCGESDQTFTAKNATFDDQLGIYIDDNLCQPCTECTTGLTPSTFCSKFSNTVCGQCTVCESGVQFTGEACTMQQDTKCTDCSTTCSQGQFKARPCTSEADLMCQDWKICSRNQFIAVEGSEESDVVCQDVKDCGPGEESTSEPTLSTDRVCTECAIGFFKAEAGNDAGCIAITPCPPGTFEMTPGNSTMQPLCPTCGDGTYTDDAGSTVCKPHVVQTCENSVEVKAPSSTSDRQCAECMSTQFYDFDSSSCQDLSTCPPGQGVSTPPTTTTDRVCSSCTGERYQDEENFTGECKTAAARCAQGFEELVKLTSVSNRECTACKDGTFKSFTDTDACNGDCGCTPYTECQAGQRIEQAGSTTRDQTCTSCTRNSDFSIDGSTELCTPVTICPAGSEEQTPPTISSDRVCATCPNGKFKSGVGLGVCMDWTNCPVGSFIIFSGNSTHSRRCEACDVGQSKYQDEVNQNECKVSQLCPIGEGETRGVTSLAGRICEPCESGTFQAESRSGATCEPWSDCVPGEEPVRRGTSRQDTVCGSCGSSEFSTDGTRCIPRRVCPAGTQASFSGSTTRDTQCSACPPGSYTDTEGTICQPFSECDDGFFELVPPTSSTNRQCAIVNSSSKSNSKSLPILLGVVAGALLLMLLVVLAIVHHRKKQQTAFLPPSASYDARTDDIAFENPMYENRANPLYDGSAQDEPGYADVQPLPSYNPYDNTNANGYMDVAPQIEDEADA